jgi:hypothetical protein
MLPRSIPVLAVFGKETYTSFEKFCLKLSEQLSLHCLLAQVIVRFLGGYLGDERSISECTSMPDSFNMAHIS